MIDKFCVFSHLYINTGNTVTFKGDDTVYAIFKCERCGQRVNRPTPAADADVIRMAREAGCVDPMVFFASYERFATLVAAAEREACAQICDKYGEQATFMAAEDIRARGQTNITQGVAK